MIEKTNILISGGRDKCINIWSIAQTKSQEILRLNSHIKNAHNSDISYLKSSPNNSNILISGSAQGEIKIWEIFPNGNLLKVFKNFNGWVYQIQILNFKISKTFKIHNRNKSPKANFKITSPKNEKKFRNSEEFDDFGFISASFDGTIKVWETGFCEPLFEINCENSMDCYPYGGLQIYYDDDKSDEVFVITSGNKKDNSLNVWTLN